jgi:hypothetical protein
MRNLLAILCVLMGCLAGLSADPVPPAWSAEVAGLRGHLAIEPTHDPDPTEPTYKVLLVLENAGQVGNLGKIRQEIRMDFSVMDLKLKVTDAKGAELPKLRADVDVDEWVPGYTLSLPPEGVLSFPIAGGGDAPPRSASGQGNPRGKFLKSDGNFDQQWVIPPADAGKYFISGTLDCVRPLHATLEERHRETPHGWQGTLILPPVELPQS